MGVGWARVRRGRYWGCRVQGLGPGAGAGAGCGITSSGIMNVATDGRRLTLLPIPSRAQVGCRARRM